MAEGSEEDNARWFSHCMATNQMNMLKDKIRRLESKCKEQEESIEMKKEFIRFQNEILAEQMSKVASLEELNKQKELNLQDLQTQLLNTSQGYDDLNLYLKRFRDGFSTLLGNCILAFNKALDHQDPEKNVIKQVMNTCQNCLNDLQMSKMETATITSFDVNDRLGLDKSLGEILRCYDVNDLDMCSDCVCKCVALMLSNRVGKNIVVSKLIKIFNEIYYKDPDTSTFVELYQIIGNPGKYRNSRNPTDIFAECGLLVYVGGVACNDGQVFTENQLKDRLRWLFEEHVTSVETIFCKVIYRSKCFGHAVVLLYSKEGKMCFVDPSHKEMIWEQTKSNLLDIEAIFFGCLKEDHEIITRLALH